MRAKGGSCIIPSVDFPLNLTMKALDQRLFPRMSLCKVFPHAKSSCERPTALLVPCQLVRSVVPATVFGNPFDLGSPLDSPTVHPRQCLFWGTQLPTDICVQCWGQQLGSNTPLQIFHCLLPQRSCPNPNSVFAHSTGVLSSLLLVHSDILSSLLSFWTRQYLCSGQGYSKNLFQISVIQTCSPYAQEQHVRPLLSPKAVKQVAFKQRQKCINFISHHRQPQEKALPFQRCPCPSP